METKPWYQSKAVIAGIIATVCTILLAFGVTGAGGVSEESEPIADNIIALIAAITAIIGIIGRIVAKTKITATKKNLSIILILSVLALSGCLEVQMSARYQQATEMSAIVVAELNARCQAGDPNACKQGLDAASETLNLLVDAMHGRADYEN